MLSIRERKISPKFLRPKFFRGRPRGMSVPKCLFFSPGFGGPDRSFWPDVRRDVRPKTSVFGLIFRSCYYLPSVPWPCKSLGKEVRVFKREDKSFEDAAA